MNAGWGVPLLLLVAVAVSVLAVREVFRWFDQRGTEAELRAAADPGAGRLDIPDLRAALASRPHPLALPPPASAVDPVDRHRTIQAEIDWQFEKRRLYERALCHDDLLRFEGDMHQVWPVAEREAADAMAAIGGRG